MKSSFNKLSKYFPILIWGKQYNKSLLSSDLIAAIIVTFMLIPQSLAYAQLAGLPVEAGLYASIIPLLIYALTGSSKVLAVGPVAVISLMIASTIGELAPAGSDQYWQIALTLALLSGLILLLLGLFKLGFLANFLSYPVISGFISASAILIAVSQLKTLLGININGHNLLELGQDLLLNLNQIQLLALSIGFSSILFLWLARSYSRQLFIYLGLSHALASNLSKLSPVIAIITTTYLSWQQNWQQAGLKVVGTIPQGLPPLSIPSIDFNLIQQLWLPALLISIVGFVESVSVGQTLAAKHRQRIEPNQELIALGSSNIATAFTSGFPVTGGFSRSVVNFDAGAQTPAAGIFTAMGISIAALFFTPALYYLPQATLAATIVIAVLSLVDFSIFKKTWIYSRTDFIALLLTVCATLLINIEYGLIIGVSASIILFLYRTSQPHIAEIGLIPGTEHFRNILRYQVKTCPTILSLRIDESLYFANTRALEDFINHEVAIRTELKNIILQCSAINDIDASALASLSAINSRLKEANICLSLSEVKGPVMDKLKLSSLLNELCGKVYLTHYQAINELAPHCNPLD